MRTIHLSNSQKNTTLCGERADKTDTEAFRHSTCYYCRLVWEKNQEKKIDD